jgi:hypothetical protein
VLPEKDVFSFCWFASGNAFDKSAALFLMEIVRYITLVSLALVP